MTKPSSISRYSGRIRLLVAAVALGATVLGVTGTAQAQYYDRGPYYGWEHRGPPRGGPRPYWHHPPRYVYGPPPVVVAPPPPPVYYAPPPAVVYPAPGLNIVIPIR